MRTGKSGFRFHFALILLESRIQDGTKNWIIFSLAVVQISGVSLANSDLLNRLQPTTTQIWWHSLKNVNHSVLIVHLVKPARNLSQFSKSSLSFNLIGGP